METLLYRVAAALVGFVQGRSLESAARLGRAAGGLAYLVDARHRRVAIRNLTMCFGAEKSAEDIRALARENFRRIGENFACAAKTAAMSFEELRPHVEFVSHGRIVSPVLRSTAEGGPPAGEKPPSAVAAIGHFGNFELYARFQQLAPGYTCATTYRALRQPSLNRLLQSMRERSGCLFFERRFDAAPLKAFMNQRGVMLGLLADQSAGTHGLRLPFFGRDCSTSAAPAVFALRYDCVLFVGICYRVGLARWRLEGSKEIPTHSDGHARPTDAIMRDVNAVFEAAVRRDPANWFWVHNRWKQFQTTVHSPQSTVHSPQSTAHGPQSTVHGPEATLHAPRSTVDEPAGGKG